MLYVFENLIKTTIVCSLGICLLLFLKDIYLRSLVRDSIIIFG